MLCWDKREPLPLAMRYHALQRYAPDARMFFPNSIAERMSAFLVDLEGRWPPRPGGSASGPRALTGPADLQRAQRRDPWSRGVLRFGREIDLATLPC